MIWARECFGPASFFLFCKIFALTCLKWSDTRSCIYKLDVREKQYVTDTLVDVKHTEVSNSFIVKHI